MLTLPILIPLVSMFLVAFLNKGVKQSIVSFIVISLTIMGAVISWLISFGVIEGQGMHYSIPWLSMIDLTIFFGIEWVAISSYISSIVYLIFVLIFIFSLKDLGVRDSINRIMAFMSGLLFFVQLLLASSYIGQIVFAWVGILFTATVLTGLLTSEHTGEKYNNIIFFGINFFAVLLFIASVQIGNVLSTVENAGDLTTQYLIFGMMPKDIIIYFFIASITIPFAIPPFNLWVEHVSDSSASVMAVVFSTLLIVSSYVLFHVLAVIDISELGRTVVAASSLITVIVSSLIALSKKNIFECFSYIYSAVTGMILFGFAVSSSEYVLLFSSVQYVGVVALFLIAGAVSHALSGEVNMTKMGGLVQHLPGIYFVFFVSVLAVLSIPPFSGFFAKTWLFSNLMIANEYTLWIGLILLSVAQFAMAVVFGRVWGLIFYGDENQDELVKAHMIGTNHYVLFSLVVLAILLLLSGWFAEKVFFNFTENDNEFNWFVIIELIISMAVSVGGLFYGFRKITKNQNDLDKVYNSPALNNNLYVYDTLVMVVLKPLEYLSEVLRKYERPAVSTFVSNIMLSFANRLSVVFNSMFNLPIILTVMLFFVIFAIVILLFLTEVKVF